MFTGVTKQGMNESIKGSMPSCLNDASLRGQPVLWPDYNGESRFLLWALELTTKEFTDWRLRASSVVFILFTAVMSTSLWVFTTKWTMYYGSSSKLGQGLGRQYMSYGYFQGQHYYIDFSGLSHTDLVYLQDELCHRLRLSICTSYGSWGRSPAQEQIDSISLNLGKKQHFQLPKWLDERTFSAKHSQRLTHTLASKIFPQDCSV